MLLKNSFCIFFVLQGPTDFLTETPTTELGDGWLDPIQFFEPILFDFNLLAPGQGGVLNLNFCSI